MELALLVWFAGVAGSLSNALVFVGFLLSAISVFGYTVWNIFSMTGTKYPKPPKKRFAIPLIMLFVTSWIVGLLIPDQKTIYMMSGAYVSQKIVQSEAADKVVKIVNTKLDEYLKEAEDKLARKEKK